MWYIVFKNHKEKQVIDFVREDDHYPLVFKTNEEAIKYLREDLTDFSHQKTSQVIQIT